LKKSGIALENFSISESVTKRLEIPRGDDFLIPEDKNEIRSLINELKTISYFGVQMDDLNRMEEYECIHCKKKFKTIEEKHIPFNPKIRRVDYENSCYRWLLLCDNTKCREKHKIKSL
jgi:hypothetical protein